MNPAWPAVLMSMCIVCAGFAAATVTIAVLLLVARGLRGRPGTWLTWVAWPSGALAYFLAVYLLIGTIA